MKTLLRYLFIAAGAVVVLVLLLSVAVLLFVDPNDYRDDIVQALNEETDREISLSGELSLDVLPCCSIRTGGISVSNPPGWPEGDFARLDSAEVSLQLWPLITRRELQVGRLSINGLMLNLLSRRDGSVNWEFTTTEEPSGPGPDDADPRRDIALDVNGITVSNAALLYTDEANGDRIELLDINMETGRIVSGEPVDLNLSLTAGGLLPDRNLKLSADTSIWLDAATQKLELQKLSARLDDSRIRGWVKFADMADPVSQPVAFDLDIDRLNADDYMSDEDAAAGAEGGSAQDIRETRIEVPAETLRSVNLNGHLAIGDLTFEGATLADVDITVKAEGGRVRLHPLTAALYGGSYAGDVRLDVRGAKPKLTVDEKLSGISVGALLADMADTDNLAALGNVGIKATASGDTVGELLDGLQGDAAFDLQEGLYQGMDLWYEIRKARARIKSVAAPVAPENPQTELSEFAGTLNFSGGVVNNRDFTAKLPFMRLSGKGSINLRDSSLDYDLAARVVETPVFEDGEELNSLKGLVLPVRIRGDIEAPKVSVDLGELAKGAAEKKLKDRLRKKLGLDQPDVGQTSDNLPANAAESQPDSDSPASEETSAEDQLKDEAKQKLKKKLRGLLD